MKIPNSVNLSIKTLRTARRQAVGEFIQVAPLIPETSLPLLIQPIVEGVNLVAWATNNQELIAKYLLKYGGILFRNFQIKEVGEFEKLIQTVSGELLEYYDSLFTPQSNSR